MIFNRAVIVAGSPALSLPLKPGDYEIRLTLDKHLPESRFLVLLPGVTEELDIHLGAE